MGHVKTTYRRGEGEHATYLRVTVNIDPSLSQMAPAEPAANPLSIVLARPAAKPEAFGHNDDFPYLTSPPGSKLTNMSIAATSSTSASPTSGRA